MREGIIELLLDAIGLLLYTVVGTLFATVGALFEYRGYLLINGGDTVFAAWIGVLGLLLFGLSYLVFTDKATAAYREFRQQG